MIYVKKWLIAAFIAFLGTTAVGSSDLTSSGLEAQAKEYPISKNFAQNLKKDKFPRSKGAVGMSYKTFSKKVGKQFSLKDRSYIDNSVVTDLNSHDAYGFSSTNKNKAKIIWIQRVYNYVIQDSSFDKYFGKNYKGVSKLGSPGYVTYIRKAGKYYFHHEDKWYTPDGQSYITIGTKKQVMNIGHVKYRELYR